MDKMVSVIIPTYNRARYISRAIKSVLDQTYTNLELLIIDDCSVDETKDMIAKFSDARIRYIRNARNRGVAYSRNTGIKNAKGEYIAFLDDDDEWRESKLEKQVDLIKRLSFDYAVIYCGYLCASSETDETVNVSPLYKGDIMEAMIHESVIGGSTPLIRKSVFYDVGFHDEELKSAVDWEMWIRIAGKYKFDYIEETLMIYRIHGKQISSDYTEKITSYNKIYEKHKQLFMQYNAEYEIKKKTFRLILISGIYKEAFKELRICMRIRKADLNTIIQFIMLITAPCILRKIVLKLDYLHLGNIYIY